TTTDDYKRSRFSWTSFAHKTKNGARMDIILCTLTAKESFGHARDSIYMQTLGEEANPPFIMPLDLVEKLSPVGEGFVPRPTLMYSPCLLNGKEVDSYAHIHSGEVMERAFVLLYEGVFDMAELTVDYAKKALGETKKYWTELSPFEIPFRIPDKDLQAMLEASARNVLQAMELELDFPVLYVGPTIYRGFWISDSRGFSECAYYMGRKMDGYGGLISLLRRVRPDGAIQYINGMYGETGAACGIIVRHCELLGDDDRLRELWPTIQRAVAHLVELNAESMKYGEDYPAYGLFPPSFGDGGLDTLQPEYANPGYVISSLQPVWRAGKRLGLPDWEKVKALVDTLIENGRKKIPRDLKTTEDGIRYLPASMLEDNDYKPQVQVGAMLPFLKEDDDLWEDYFKLLDKVDDAQGIPENTGWMHDQSVFGYASMPYAREMIDHGRGQKAVDYIYAFCNHAAPSRVWREEQPLVDTPCADYCGDMPHNWGSANLIITVRKCIISENGDKLELLPALADEWLPTEGNELEFGSSPTRFGLVSLRLEKDGGGYSLSVKREKGAIEPEATRLYWKDKVLSSSVGLKDLGDGWYEVPAGMMEFTAKLEK
ncbi:MAG: hypothetical protein PHO66_05110, partial [Eubacteriales bacterium]|nr:hypothetical protein [Eubacteriales bacterium]